MIKILKWSDWKKINLKLKQQREQLRIRYAVMLKQESEIASLQATIIGLKEELEEAEKLTVSARSKCRAIGMVIAQKGITPTNKLKEILLILE